MKGKIPFELIFWVLGLAFIFFTAGPGGTTHFTLCPLALAGMDWCPGCGLGHSIGELFHGHLGASIATHPLGVFALGIILHRIYTLLKLQINYHGYRNN